METRILFISNFFFEKGTNIRISHLIYKMIIKEVESRISGSGLIKDDVEAIGIMFSSSRKLSKAEISYDENCSHSQCFFVKLPFVTIENDQANIIFYTELIIETLSLIISMVYSDICITNCLIGLRNEVLDEIKNNFENYQYLDPLEQLRK